MHLWLWIFFPSPWTAYLQAFFLWSRVSEVHLCKSFDLNNPRNPHAQVICTEASARCSRPQMQQQYVFNKELLSTCICRPVHDPGHAHNQNLASLVGTQQCGLSSFVGPYWVAVAGGVAAADLNFASSHLE
mmetsp:Transcript_40871/g.122017  ORF Transcript_40871/g.122017 Transcript_40871/m.122017 type:complete len:131 (-) Transcript_40871:833-1225(-)